MRGIIVVLTLFVCASAIQTEDLEWEAFKTKHNRNYSPEEHDRRYKIFMKNKMMIEEHNKKFDEGLLTFKLGINKFADMLPEETKYLRGYKKPTMISVQEDSYFKADEGTRYPDTVDWRKEGYVTPVKNQGHCGSCWAFSATGSLEGQNFKKTGKLVSLSEQNLVDCTPDCGCNGGWMIKAFNYVNKNGGIDSEDSYPYYAVDQNCTYNESERGGMCSGFRLIIPGNENVLMAATATEGPISTAIDASHSMFTYYESGIHYDPNCSSINTDHGVLVVGYGTQDEQDYWLVKNSWGTDWGMDGYIMMARNKGNNCGIASDPSFPVILVN